MARKDNKGRNLKTGEYQRPDGRYEYRYKDEITGKRNSVYAADLASLREMEKKINKDMDDQLITDASVKKLTVNTLFERYMATKNIRERTKKNYTNMWDYRVRNTLGNIRVVDFKTSHVRTFFFKLSDEGLAHSTIKGFYAELKAQTADFDPVELYEARQVIRPVQEKAVEQQLEDTMHEKPSLIMLLSAKQKVSRLLGENNETVLIQRKLRQEAYRLKKERTCDRDNGER